MLCLQARSLLFVSLFALLFSSAHAVTIFEDNFDGGAVPLDTLAPDIAPGAETWVAAPGFNADGSLTQPNAGTATLAFTPLDGSIYTLDASITGITGNSDWIGLGFSNGQLNTNGTNNRFLNGNVVQGRAWMMIRGDDSTGQTFLAGNGGGAPWDSAFVPTNPGGDVDMRVVLDTTGGPGTWNATWFAKRPADPSYIEVRSQTVLGNETIDSFGFALARSSATITGTIESILLDQSTPAPPNQWNVDGGGSFNVAGNWLDNVVPTDVAIFGSVLTSDQAPGTGVSVDSAASVNEIRFQGGSTYILEGTAPLTLTGAATVTNNGAASVIITTLSGSNGLTKTGGSTVFLANEFNNYTGDTNIDQGVLALFTLDAINQSSGVVNIADTATLRLSAIPGVPGSGPNGTLSEEIQGPAGSLVRLQEVEGNEDGLTTEVITLTTANPLFDGEFSVGGGTLVVANNQALGSTTGGTTVAGSFTDQATLQLSDVTVTGEELTLVARQPDLTTAHLSNVGTSEWAGNIVGLTGGNQFNIESQSGTLTLSGDISLPDSAQRFLNLSGAGDGVISGQILDNTIADGDGADNASVSLVKSGSGTWTIATIPPPDVPEVSSARDAYHQRRTVISEGTLAVQSSGIGSDEGELFSQTIEVAAGATFDVSSFTNYSLQILDDPDGNPSTGDETGQIVSGAGSINVSGGSFEVFDDSVIQPGDDGVGTLSVSGNLVYRTFTSTPAGSLDFDLGDTTSPADSDRLVVSGSTTINATSASDRIQVNISPVDGPLAGGSYTLIQSGSLNVNGAAGNSTYAVAVFDSRGIDITAGLGQTVQIQNSGSNVIANVSAGRNLTWSPASGAWDVQTSNNWTGDDTQFSQLDRVTFANSGNTSVTVGENVNVAPGSVTFNGGGGSIHTLTGDGGMTGFGPVNVVSGTVQLQNKGNTYAGTTTIDSGARLEIDSASTGSFVVNGTLSVGGAGVATGGNQTFYSDDFSGAGGSPLNGTTPDTSYDGQSWVASAIFEDNGNSGGAGQSGGSATLGFVPLDGSTYVLEATIENITGDSDWFALGFANGQSAATGSNNRFITGNVVGTAWTLFRGDNDPAATNPILNQTQLGTGQLGAGNNGLGGQVWDALEAEEGGNIELRVELDTTGGPGTWTATWLAKRPTDPTFTEIRTTTLVGSEENFTSIGIANSNGADLSGSAAAFSLTGTEPAESRLLGQTLSVDGDFTMSAGSTLELDFAAVGQDFVDVSGAATLDGTIDITKLGSFTPEPGSEFTFLTAAEGITDLGVNFVLPSGATASIVDMTDLVVSFAAGLGGDFNDDGIVDLADYTIWRNNLGEDDSVLPPGSADGTTPIVDANEYQLWRSNFGATSSVLSQAGGNAAVPEPGTWLLALLGCSFAAMRVRARRQK